jgi:hypothetical protein
VVDLVLTRPWLVGNVRFLPAASTRPLVAESRAVRGEPQHHWYDDVLDQGLAAQFDEHVVAEVTCEFPADAYEQVADALAALRLLQHERAPMVDTDWQTFGLPGQVRQWHVEYIELGSGPTHGFFRGGSVPGWTFTDEDYDAFQSHAGLQFLSKALAKQERTSAEQRAILGARLLSASTLEQDADQKLLAAVMALEVLLSGDDDEEGPKKFRLARRYAFLTCSVPMGSMCGRDRASCSYLASDPDDKKQRQAVIGMLERARSDARVICSEYFRVINWYNARNRVVHDGTVGEDVKAVRNALYSLYRWFVPQAYRWYATHSDDALRQLDEEIARIVDINPPESLPDP